MALHPIRALDHFIDEYADYLVRIADRFIRDRLRNGDPPWRVEELRATNLAEGKPLVDRLECD